MSKPKKKIVVTTNPKETVPTTRTAATRARSTAAATPKAELVFGRPTYIWMGIGAGLIALGLLLMAGGKMPSPDLWEPERIYSFRRTVLAPIVILAGLAVEIYAIFKK
jgi:hypothetical protein